MPRDDGRSVVADRQVAGRDQDIVVLLRGLPAHASRGGRRGDVLFLVLALVGLAAQVGLR